LTVTDTITTRRVLIEAPSPEAIAPYGELIGSAVGVPAQKSVYYENSANYTFESFSTDADALVIVSRSDPRPLRVRWMERHSRQTQLFVPLGGASFVMVLAPPTDAELPDLDEIRAFRFDGSTGVLLKRNTWHDYPYALLSGTDLVIVLRRETYSSLNVLEDGESQGPDLEKRDLVRRLGVQLELTFGAPQTEIG
jgi:ureidoglycolate lyase